MEAQQAFEALRKRLEGLLLLNPDMGVTELEELYTLAGLTTGAHFDEIAASVGHIVDGYLDSAPKRVAAQTLAEYFDYVNHSARLLAERGEVQKEPPKATEASQSVALVPRELYTPLEWCKVLCGTDLPRDLARAVDACRRRNELVGTVVEYAFVVLLRADAGRALRWQLAWLEERRGDLDPDVVRDLINAWLTQATLPRAALAWAESWSADENLQQQWPHVVRRADRMLCQHALNAWMRGGPVRSAVLSRLHVLAQTRRTDDQSLLGWLRAALMEVGESILRFVSLSRSTETEGAEPWRSGAIVREILRVEGLFTPVMLTADRILDVPDGANTFAVAFFGLVGNGRQQWEAKLATMAEEAVRQAFLRDLREGLSPVQTIRRLTFGNREAFETALGELDATTMRFDSLRQRERVVRFLAVFYASYRQQELLEMEILRRYRSLMRLMHEDHLRRVLEPVHFAEVAPRGILRDLAAVAAEARRFLTRRRALESSLPELVAAEVEFIQGIRLRRLRLIHTLLG